VVRLTGVGYISAQADVAHWHFGHCALNRVMTVFKLLVLCTVCCDCWVVRPRLPSAVSMVHLWVLVVVRALQIAGKTVGKVPMQLQHARGDGRVLASHVWCPYLLC